MLSRWIERWRWRRSSEFQATVARVYEETVRLYGEGAFDHAQRKLRRRHQPVRRKWIWRAVVARLKAEALAARTAGSYQSLPNNKAVKQRI